MRKYIKINEDRVFFLDKICLINTGAVNMVFDYGGEDEYLTPALEQCDQRSLLVRIEAFLLDDEEGGLRVIIKDKSWSIDPEGPPMPDDEGDTDYGPGNGSLSCGYDEAVTGRAPFNDAWSLNGMKARAAAVSNKLGPRPGHYTEEINALPSPVDIWDQLNDELEADRLKADNDAALAKAEQRGYDNATAELKEAARHVGDPKGREAGVKRVRAERLEAHNDLINDIARGLTTPQEAASNSLGLNSLDPPGAAMKREASKPPEGVSQGGPDIWDELSEDYQNSPDWLRSQIALLDKSLETCKDGGLIIEKNTQREFYCKQLKIHAPYYPKPNEMIAENKEDIK